MTSLADAYERRAGEVSRRRVLAGTALFAAGALLVVCGILAGATPLLSNAGVEWWRTREIAGVLAGLGIPAAFVGVFTVLPASRQQRTAAALGLGIAILGVLLFQHAYPYEWGARQPTTLALLTVLVYVFGTLTTFWCLFTSVATFKRRNDPGGTVTLEYTVGGETKTMTVDAADAADARAALGGGIGVFGGVDDPDTDAGTASGAGASGPAGPTGRASVSDGGASADADIRSPTSDDGMVLSDETPRQPGAAADRYCGNCAHFQHVRADGGIRPYCGKHDELMDDMEACEQWEPNSTRL